MTELPVPIEISRYFKDAYSIYMKLFPDNGSPLTVIEMSKYDVTVQKYITSDDELYEYRYDDEDDMWKLYIIKRNGSVHLAEMRAF